MPVFSFLVYILVSTFTPGPNNFMAMLFAHQYGFRRTIPFCLGVGAGFCRCAAVQLLQSVA